MVHGPLLPSITSRGSSGRTLVFMPEDKERTATAMYGDTGACCDEAVLPRCALEMFRTRKDRSASPQMTAVSAFTS
jgi:hypothetical protein